MRGRPLDDSRLSDTGFLTGGGEMADLIRDFDWSATSIGPIADWPQSLKTAVGLVVKARRRHEELLRCFAPSREKFHF